MNRMMAVRAPVLNHRGRIPGHVTCGGSVSMASPATFFSSSNHGHNQRWAALQLWEGQARVRRGPAPSRGPSGAPEEVRRRGSGVNLCNESICIQMKNEGIFLLSATFNVISMELPRPRHHTHTHTHTASEAGAPCLLLISTAGQRLHLLNFISAAILSAFLPPPARRLCSASEVRLFTAAS